MVDRVEEVADRTMYLSNQGFSKDLKTSESA